MSQMIRTNYRAGFQRSQITTSSDATGLITLSFPGGMGNPANMLYVINASTPGTGVEGSLPVMVTPTASFSGLITWVKVWSSTTSAAAATFNIAAAAIFGSV